MNKVRLKRLQCSGCGGKLEGENNSRIFFCRLCKLAFDMGNDESEPTIFSYIAPLLKKEYPMVYFPFQRISAVIRIKDVGSGGETASKSVFHIPLFFIKNVNNFGDIGYYYFLKKIVPEPDIDRELPIFPADRSYNDLKPYPEIYIRRRESEKRGMDSFLIEIQSRRDEIMLIPFYKYVTDYYDSYLFWKYPSGALV